MKIYTVLFVNVYVEVLILFHVIRHVMELLL